MLYEIVKGMSNASEAINDNFQFGSIVEDNLDETNPVNGYYVRFGNGLQVSWLDHLELEYISGISLEKTWDFPIAFSEAPIVVPIAEDAVTALDHRGLSPYLLNRTKDSVLVQMSRMSGDVPFSSGDTRSTVVFAIGKWDKQI